METRRPAVSIVIPTPQRAALAVAGRHGRLAPGPRATRPAEIVVVVDHNPALYRRARRDLAGVTVLENALRPGRLRQPQHRRLPHPHRR